jgi:hypothetical protein
MNAETRAGLLGRRHHRVEELADLAPKFFLAHAPVAAERSPQHIQRIAFLRPRQARDDRLRQLVLRLLIHGVICRLGLCDPLGRVFGLGVLAPQDEQVEGCELRRIEAQRQRAVRQAIGEVGARPVDDRHEVEADRPDVAGPEIADGLRIGVQMRPPVAGAGLDVLRHRHALHHRPGEAGRGDLRLAPFDLRYRPHRAIRQVVQRAHDAGGTRLPDMLQRNRILRTEPPPGLFHRLPHHPASPICFLPRSVRSAGVARPSNCTS